MNAEELGNALCIVAPGMTPGECGPWLPRQVATCDIKKAFAELESERDVALEMLSRLEHIANHDWVRAARRGREDSLDVVSNIYTALVALNFAFRDHMADCGAEHCRTPEEIEAIIVQTLAEPVTSPA